MNNKSFKTEVLVDGRWSGNNLRFATKAEAIEYGKELLSRWFAPIDSRAVASEDEVNYFFNFDSYKAEPIEGLTLTK